MLDTIAIALIKGALTHPVVLEDMRKMGGIGEKVDAFFDNVAPYCYVRPNIPEVKLVAAINSFAVGLDPDEVIVLMDFGSFSTEKRDGLIITEDALYTGKDSSKKILLRDIESIQLYRDHLYINEQHFCGIVGITPFHKDMLDIYISNINPKSRDMSITTTEGFLGFIQNTRTQQIKNCSRIYTKPLIPRSMLANEANKYKINANDIILIAEADTDVLSNEHGFILTEDYLYASASWASSIKPMRFKLREISHIKLSFFNGLSVNGNKIYSFFSEKHVAADFDNLLRKYLENYWANQNKR